MNEGWKNDSEKGLEALINLDKRFQLKDLQNRVQSVLFFLNFFEDYPDPFLADYAFLKLSDYWWRGDNVVRQYILKVFRKCQARLAKISSQNEILRRIISVLSSNDPVAKAFTLRLLGCISIITIDRADVHHKIRLFLCQRNEVELSAAIYAAEMSSRTSKLFSESVFSGLEYIIKDNMYNPVISSRIISIYRNMHHSDELARKALFSLLRLKKLFQKDEMQLSCVFYSMTILCQKAIYLVKPVIDILISNLDSALVVQHCVLSCLKVIIKTHMHLFDSKKFMDILDFCFKTERKVALKAFGVLWNLCKHDIFVYRFISPNEHYDKFFKKVLYINENLDCLLSEEMQPFLGILYMIHKYCKANAAIGTYVALVELIENIASRGIPLVKDEVCRSFSASNLNLSFYLKALFYLSQMKDSDEVWESLLLEASITSEESAKSEQIVTGGQNTKDQSKGINEVVLWCTREKAHIVANFLAFNTKVLPNKLLLKVIISYIRTRNTNSEVILLLVNKFVKKREVYWYKYLVSCEALARGMPQISLLILTSLLEKISSENTRFWLMALINISKSSLALREGVSAKNISDSLRYSWNSLSFIRAINKKELHTNFLKLQIGLYTNFYTLVRIKELNSQIPQKTLFVLEESTRNLYCKFDKLLNSLENDPESRTAVHSWANFCSMLSDFLLSLISESNNACIIRVGQDTSLGQDSSLGQDILRNTPGGSICEMYAALGKMDPVPRAFVVSRRIL